jgi:hypothetical protein
MEKKPWSQPILVCVVRGEPQEAILTVCKSGAVGGGPNQVASNCAPGDQQACTSCFYGPSS